MTVRGMHKTDIEKIMYNALDEEKIVYVKQFPIRGSYILDCAIPELKIDIECDGTIWHENKNDHDRKRNWALRNKGWLVIRFTDIEIKNNIRLCVQKIKEAIERRQKENGES